MSANSQTACPIPDRPQDKLLRFIGLTPWLMKMEITANQFTIGRGILILPVIVLANFGLYLVSFWLHIISWIGDGIDGPLARERLRTDMKDDQDLGAYIDPMIDKASWVSTAVFVPWAGDYSHVSDWILAIAISAQSTLVVIEALLAIVRWQDFRTKYAGKKTELNLDADWSGKTKMVLEVVGLSALLLAMHNPDYLWAYWLWGLSLLAAVPLGGLSLLGKLKRRKA